MDIVFERIVLQPHSLRRDVRVAGKFGFLLDRLIRVPADVAHLITVPRLCLWVPVVDLFPEVAADGDVPAFRCAFHEAHELLQYLQYTQCS